MFDQKIWKKRVDKFRGKKQKKEIEKIFEMEKKLNEQLVVLRMLLRMNWLLMTHVKMHVVDVERQHHYQVVIQLNPVEPKPQAQLVAMNCAIVEKQNYVPNLNEYLRVCY